MKLKPAKTIIRDNRGHWTHPDILIKESYSPLEWDEFLRKYAIDVIKQSMFDTACDEICSQFFEHASTTCLPWKPKAPSKHAFLISIHESNDGPVAWWATHK